MERAKEFQVIYRDSILPQILAYSLGGTALSTMIACVSTCADQAWPTEAALEFANWASQIQNHVDTRRTSDR